MAYDDWIMGATAAMDNYNPNAGAFPPAPPTGQIEPGNIDIHHRPRVMNPDGSVSTVRSVSSEEDGQEVLYPTVRANPFRPYTGWIMSDDKAREHYQRTGQHLGKFDTPENADTYAVKLHEDQAQEYVPADTQTAPKRVYITGGQPAALPDVGPPVLSGGPQISKGVAWANNLATKLPAAIVESTRHAVETPGALMKPNPYPEGSEEWHSYEDMKTNIATDWAAGQAINQMGSGVVKGVTVAPGEKVLGSGPVRVTKAQKIMPEVAERYPETVPPVVKTDPKSGKAFEGKGTSPEAAEVSKLRSAAQKDIDAGNYTPYFDPKKRFDVNPADYPAYEPTVGTVAQRPKEKNAAAYNAASGPEAAARLDAAFERGMKQQKGAENWYMMGQLEREYIKEYGAVEGKRQFKAKFADAMAATTGGASPKDNLMMAAYGNYLKTHGMQLPEASNLYPYPIADRLGNMIQFKKMMMEGSGLTPTNPKRYNFSHNYLGNKAGSTIDEQMMGLLDPSGVFGGSPPKGAYGNLEGPVNARAAEHGVDPRYYQEVAWAGGKDAKEAARGKGGFKAQPMIDIVNEAIERTHRITGMARDEIVRRGLVRGEIPLYGLAGATTMGGIAAQDRYQGD